MTAVAAKTTVFKKGMKLMGNHFEISVVAANELWAHEMIAKGVIEIQRIEKLLTTYDPGSETNQINQAAGIAPVKVS
jgi:thiamine biosynthesis lipoprotein